MKRLPAGRARDKEAPSAALAMFLCWLAYTAAYGGRYSYNSNITAIISRFGVDHGEAGLATTCFFFAYGAGQVVNGILCRRYSPRRTVPAALAVSALLNLAVYLGAPFGWFKYLWLLNGAVQSMLWPTLILTLSQSLRPGDLARSVVVMSTTVPAGTLLTYGFSALLALWGGFRYSFLAGALVMLAAAAAWLRGYGRAFGKVRPREPEAPEASPQGGSAAPSLALPLLGLLGAACNTLLNRRIRSFLSLTGAWYLLAALCMGGAVLLMDSSLWQLVLAALGLVSLAMHGVNNVITSMAPLYMRGQIHAGLLAGILNGCCYVGSTASSYGLGWAADRFGWNGVFLLLLGASCVPVLLAAAAGLREKRKGAAEC